MPAIHVICSACHRITLGPIRGRCQDCHTAWQKQDGTRRQAHPRARIYADPRWKQAARACLTRDHWRCVDCGRHQTQIDTNERLGADHVVPILECSDPYELGNLQTLCSTCSGSKDGGRANPKSNAENPVGNRKNYGT